MERKLKSQSAMEYLMTYSWAILIIAVAMATLFELGVFDPLTFAPKAAPGACQIYRPNGPGTTQSINTQGLCNNEIPQYVAKFNGVNSKINITATSILKPSTAITVSAWIRPPYALNPLGTDEGIAMGSSPPGAPVIWGLDYGANGGTARLYIDCGCNNIASPVSRGFWVFVAGTYDGSTMKLYVNGTLIASSSYSQSISSPTNFYIGFLPQYQYFNGSIANIQVYNASLSANVIYALYHEGIGGVPITLQNLVGWWPLNGDAQDYSGDNLNGISTNVTFFGAWYKSGYAAP